MRAIGIQCLAILLTAIVPGFAGAERVKDLASFSGVRTNQLVGFGLVVGLDRTGDKTRFTGQGLRSMLARLGVTMPPGIDPKAKNIAAVTVHADLPAFAKPGQTIDVTVSSIGDAKSLRGGSLLMTPLKGADGEVYAMAQGNLIVGGLSASGQDGSKITVNVPSVGRVPNGATVERVVPTPFAEDDAMILNLHTPDFTTANRIATAINRVIGEDGAQAMDGASVKIPAPRQPGQRVEFASMIENVEVSPGDAPARIIVNSRTGTVVVNGAVRVQPAAVSHGNLVVTISENPQVSQPQAFGRGSTAVVPQSNVQIQEESKRMFLFNPGVSLEEIVRAVNNVGAAPSDLVAILEALKTAGALRAELVVI